VVISVFIKLDSAGPVFFAQRRAGANDREFLMYKFRTMAVGTPELATDKLENSGAYITKVGRYLRKYSIDELPQLLNILHGDMSLVGPRPALFNQYQLRAMRNNLSIAKLKPGLTGWAQINGRDEIPLQAKVEYDLYYLHNRNFLLDMVIMYRTLLKMHTGDRVRVTTD
jgi:Sugar transferases involved in lipopolysaccharide synthesis